MPWTAPQDLTFDDELLSELHRRPQGYLIGFADGTERFVPKRDEKILKALVTRARGETVDLTVPRLIPDKECGVGTPGSDKSFVPKNETPPAEPRPKTIEKKLEEPKKESPAEGAMLRDVAMPKPAGRAA